MRLKQAQFVLAILVGLLLVSINMIPVTYASPEPGTTSILSFNKVITEDEIEAEVGINGFQPVAVYSNDTTLFVVDTVSGKVNLFDHDGNYLGRFGESGSNVGQIGSPVDVIQFHQMLIVPDAGFSRLLAYDLSGNYVTGYQKTVAGFGQLTGISRMTTNDTHLFVMDNTRGGVVIFNSSLLPVAEFDSSITTIDLVNARDIVVDDDFVYFLDDLGTSGNIKVYQHDGVWKRIIGIGETTIGGSPLGMEKHGDLLYVSQFNDILIYNFEGTYVGGLSEPLHPGLTGTSFSDLVIVDGKMVVVEDNDNELIFLDVDVNNIELYPAADYIKIAWGTPSKFGGSNVTHFYVYRGSTPSSLKLIEQVSADSMSYKDETVETNTSYYYAVSAGNIFGQTALSPVKSSKIDVSDTGLPEIVVPENVTVIITEQLTEEITISEGGFASYPIATVGMVFVAMVIVRSLFRNRLR